ncbi:cysteine-rich VLP domain-containing protein [Cytobacillus firmus]|uniref:cysteine-rich VLP protein n=1 Tax=Cytobacillus oceanisediminis TaxID=665099 RepID=UPI00203C0AF8|nr:cysteine-rich VLP protein [Cytobacillus oceanisediminis]MCM3246538.1 cysteine-rich VLP domain-containing protein [Cytobacillus oceanisediminis]MCS0822706.1 cysteine-rich VLP domain-containing protein [Cytobacillus firmus]
MKAKEKGIKKLITNSCANYVEASCLLLDRQCPLISGGEYRGKEMQAKACSCSYFEKSVLPANSTLEAIYFGKGTLNKLCIGCGKGFNAVSNRAVYCSDLCRNLARRKTHRKYNNKRG